MLNFTYEDYLNRASKMIAEGSFPSKAAQKDVFQDLARAFDRILDMQDRQALEDAGYKWGDMIIDLHNLRDKHIEMLTVALGKEMAIKCYAIGTLRQIAKEMPIIKPAPKAKPAPTGNQATHQGTCQICGRIHKVNNVTGLVATHGYTVDYGYFNGACSGSSKLPLEVSCDALKQDIDGSQAYVEGLDPYGVTKAFRNGRERVIPNQSIIKMMMSHIENQQKRLEAWKPAELIKVGA